MKLTKFTNKELDLITVGIINQFEYIEPIDKDYHVTYEIQEYGEHHTKVTFFWNIGCFEHDDEKVVTDTYYFIINKIDTLRKYTKEINDALDLIVNKSFDTELQDWEFNDKESW
jgi:hypothetical protein